MRLNFDDDDAYSAARDALLDELRCWLERPDDERAGIVADVGIFLDWRYRESNGVLDDFTPSDVVEFLLQWCPRRFKGHPNGAFYLCNAVGVYSDFMAATGRLVGGVERATRLKRVAADLIDTVRAEMSDPTPELSSIDEEHPRLYEAMREIDETFGPGAVEEAEPYELPFIYVPPPAHDVEAAAAGAPLLAKLDALRDYLGADGKQLTDKGNLKLADGRALVDLLGTGDEMDPRIGDKVWRTSSTANLPRLNLVLDLAKEAGAVRVRQRRLVPVKAWAARSVQQRATALFAAIVELGPLETMYSRRIWYLDELHQVLDDGIVHWLAPLLEEDTAELPFETFVEWAQSVVHRELARYVPDRGDSLAHFTPRDMGTIFGILEEAGVVRWDGRTEVPPDFGIGPSDWTGGTLTLTALGRHLLPDYLDEAGYVLRRLDSVADGDGAALIDALSSVPDTQREAVVSAWSRDRPPGERARLLTEAIAATADAASRVKGFAALNHLDLEAAEPFVRQLLDTPVAGHAALWLIAHERADASTLGSFVDIGVLVDMLAELVEVPEELCALFTSMSVPSELLESMWRHPAPETVEVLETLGRHLSDRALAKAARKAAVRHRSWIANRG